MKSLKKFTHWIAAKAIKDHQSVNDLKVRARYGALEGWASIVINLLLFVVKIVLGLSVRSVVFDIALEEDTDEQETYDIMRSIREKVKSKFPEMKVVIKAEPKYAYNV